MKPKKITLVAWTSKRLLLQHTWSDEFNEVLNAMTKKLRLAADDPRWIELSGWVAVDSAPLQRKP